MKLFKNMSLNDAKDFYEKLKSEKNQLIKERKDVWFLLTAMDDIYFFTDGFRHDY